MEHPSIRELFPDDVIARAQLLTKAIPGGLGAYRYGSEANPCSAKFVDDVML